MRRRVSLDRLMVLLVSLVLIAVAASGYRLSQDDSEVQYVGGRLGEFAPYNDGEIRVDEVRVADTLTRRGKAALETDAIFVVVRVTVRAPGRLPVRFSDAELVSQNATFAAVTVNGESADPGFQVAQEVAFEVSPDRMADLSLETEDGAVVRGYRQRARIHLGITAANAADWRAAAVDRRAEIVLDEVSEGLG